MRIRVAILLLASCVPALADYRITRDFGGDVEEYKAKYARLRQSDERVVIDGICNSACGLVLGIVPLNRICATPRASLGFHQAYFDKRWTAGIRVTSYAGTAELLAIYPQGAARRAQRRDEAPQQRQRPMGDPRSVPGGVLAGFRGRVGSGASPALVRGMYKPTCDAPCPPDRLGFKIRGAKIGSKG